MYICNYFHNNTTAHNSYLLGIGVHEMHGRMHPNYWQITILLVVDLCSSLAYFMMTQPLPITGKLPIKTLVAKQLPTNTGIMLCAFTCTVDIRLFSRYFYKLELCRAHTPCTHCAIYGFTSVHGYNFVNFREIVGNAA